MDGIDVLVDNSVLRYLRLHVNFVQILHQDIFGSGYQPVRSTTDVLRLYALALRGGDLVLSVYF
jgi:hypothetical protein